MEKEGLPSDAKFKQKCNEYGLNYPNIHAFENIILLSTPIEGLYIILDKNYNTIGIEKNASQKLELFANDFYEKYSKSIEETPSNKLFEYPFENYTIKKFIDFSNIIDELDNKDDTEYVELISYIKFISKEIQNHFMIIYQL